jgi:hypothetical protein
MHVKGRLGDASVPVKHPNGQRQRVGPVRAAAEQSLDRDFTRSCGRAALGRKQQSAFAVVDQGQYLELMGKLVGVRRQDELTLVPLGLEPLSQQAIYLGPPIQVSVLRPGRFSEADERHGIAFFAEPVGKLLAAPAGVHRDAGILDVNGNPIRNAVVEIWQVDKGRDRFTTQCYIKDHPGNERDGIWRSIRDPQARESVTVDFAPVKDSKIGELAAKFDIVLGFTPEA